MKLSVFIFLAIFLLVQCKTRDEKNPLYKDKNASIEDRVEDLLARMTLEEKVGQTLSGGDGLFWDSVRNFNPAQYQKKYPYGVGLLGVWENSQSLIQYCNEVNRIQKFFVEETRLGIPALIIGEGLHGFMAKGATSFPQALGLASTWDTILVENVFVVTSEEMRLRGVTQAFSPVVDLGREPRWGRTEETFGEDPYLVSRIGLAAVNGFQGRKGALGPNKVVATLKHFAGHGGPENGTNIAPAPYGERTMRETYLFPFEVCVKEGNALCVMASYNEWDGIPSHGNKRLLKGILQKEWGFKGYVVGDLGGTEELVTIHHLAQDSMAAAIQSMDAGVDIELIKYNGCYPALVQLIKDNKFPVEKLDSAVADILRVKFKLGLFENPYANVEDVERLTNNARKKELALLAAQKSMVLLKNENNMLPLNINNVKNLAVIGPNAADIHLGGYSYEPREGVSVLDGFKKKGEGKFNVLYARGCGITTDIGSFWKGDSAKQTDPAEDERLIKEAVVVAKKADAVVLVLGENETTNREAWSEKHLGDRDDLNLIGKQNQLAAALLATGKPVIVLLLNGRPLSINFLAQKAPAILEGWYLGQETGNAVASVVFGEYNPGGKLPITFPRSVGQLPAFYNKKPSRHRSYLFADNGPLFPFGHGLSYTTFEYSVLALSNTKMKADESVNVEVTVKNSGNAMGEEVVQLYIRDKVSSVTRPVMELKGFARISLSPGESKRVSFPVNKNHLWFYNQQMERVVEPGEFEIMVGSSSADIRQRGLLVVE